MSDRRRIKLIVQYDGSGYHGFQIQPNAITVEERLEEGLRALLGEDIKVVASGRTDTGVHAIGQAVHFDTVSSIPVERIPYALQAYLPCDIGVISAEETDNDFHARYSAKRKTYEYRVVLTDVNLPLENKRAYQYKYNIDTDRIKEGAKYIIGEHNFSAFMSAGSSVDNAVREVYSLDIERSGNAVVFRVCANGFLYNMVRIIVGTLLDVGRGRFEPQDVARIIESRDRGNAGATAPPDGLYLKSVEY